MAPSISNITAFILLLFLSSRSSAFSNTPCLVKNGQSCRNHVNVHMKAGNPLSFASNQAMSGVYFRKKQNYLKVNNTDRNKKLERKASAGSSSFMLKSSLSSTATEEASTSVPLFEAPFKGIIRDYKRRLPYMKSDITDGLNEQCLAATIFLFFACLAPAVGFGAMYYAATNGAIGTIEMVTSTAASGESKSSFW